MRKFFAMLLAAVVLAVSMSVFAVSADVAPKFTEKFFPTGEANAPEDVYYQIRTDDEGRAEYVYVWLTQPDDILALFNEWNYLGEDLFIETYGCTLEKWFIQIDCKVDDGDWHYMPEWDIDEYPQEDQPYDLAIRQRIWADENQKTYRHGGALIDPYYAQDDENAGYLKPVVVSEDDGWYLDMENHSLTLRLRYMICYRNDNMTEEEMAENGDDNRSFILSDWSEEITIGKNATQEALVYPETIEAPVISELTFVETIDREGDNDDTSWKVYVDFPESVGAAEKYYTVEMDAFEPLCATTQYRVKTDGEWGDWCETYWGNPTWLFSDWNEFVTEAVSKDDEIEFRVYISNNVEDDKNSPYSNSLFANAGASTQEEPESRPDNESGSVVIDDPTEPKSKCKVCGICPFQPLGICLFIWLAIVLLVIILIAVILKKAKNKKNKKSK